jgi:hypothetical protein
MGRLGCGLIALEGHFSLLTSIARLSNRAIFRLALSRLADQRPCGSETLQTMSASHTSLELLMGANYTKKFKF